MKKRLKAFVEQSRWLKWFPNFLTICNSLCGFAAIVNALGYSNRILNGDCSPENVFVASSFMILGAMIFDCLDGFAARLLHAASLHGVQMDSLSDMVTFGVAPATLVTVMTYSMKFLDLRHQVLVWLMASVYLGCAALRLATYNVHAMLEKKSSDKFHGLPSPGAAAALCTTIIFCGYYDSIQKLEHYWYVLPAYGMVLGFLMVSNIQYTHFGKWVVSVKRNRRRLIALLLLLAAFAFRPITAAFLFVNLYVLWGVLAACLRKIGVFKPIPEEA